MLRVLERVSCHSHQTSTRTSTCFCVFVCVCVCEEVKEDEMSKECSFDGEHLQVPLCLYCCLRSMQLKC